MIEEGLVGAWPSAVGPAVARFLQGHLIERPPLFYAADLRHPVWQTSRLVAEEVADELRGEDFIDVAEGQRPPYGIITTQTCDLAEERPNPRQPWLAVAPVYRIPSSATLRDRDYICVLAPPTLNDELWVADLRIEMPLEKSLLVDRVPIEGFRDEEGYIDFGDLLARRRGRPALASVFHDVLSTTTRRLKDESTVQRNLARAARRNVYKLMLAIEDGTRLAPISARLYVVTLGARTDEARDWFHLWWNDARAVADDQGLQLLPTGWLNAEGVDARLYDDLIEMRSPL